MAPRPVGHRARSERVGRVPAKTSVLFLCVTALSLVFIVVYDQQTTQTQPELSGDINALSAIVVASPTSIEDPVSELSYEEIETAPRPAPTIQAQVLEPETSETLPPTEPAATISWDASTTAVPDEPVAYPLDASTETLDSTETTEPPISETDVSEESPVSETASTETEETPVTETDSPETTELPVPETNLVEITASETELPVPETTPPPQIMTPAPSNTSFLIPAVSTTSPPTRLHPLNYNLSIDGDLATNFECVGWRQTGTSSPDGPREPQHDKACQSQIRGGVSGYCVFRHLQSGELRRVLILSPSSMPSHIGFKCNAAGTLLRYGQDSVSYVHNATFQFDDNKNETLTKVLADRAAHRNASTDQESESHDIRELSFDKGITMVVHDKALGSAYVSIRLLRSLDCRLPVELWYKYDEVKPDHPILEELVAKYGVFLREIVDPRATKFYTKLHAVFYSAFDHVLLLDADNFAVRDPSYLFHSPEYASTGAMFWPDMWRPASTIFHIVKEDLLWEVLGMDFVDMFEQESGQVLIDRRRHQKALNVLMYYGFSLPRVHESMEFQWGDKDLFRFAWLKTNSSFHFIQRPVGLGGRYHTEKRTFCGVTMVQHDPRGEIVFLHRNAEKMVAGQGNKRVWTHIEQLKVDAPLDKYTFKYHSNVFPDTAGCWGFDETSRHFYTMTPLTEFPFWNIETELIHYGEEAGELIVEPSAATEPPRWTPKPTKSARWSNHGKIPKTKAKQRTALRQNH